MATDFLDSETPMDKKRFGSWLIGGASNVGCAVLRQEEFSNEELAELGNQIYPSTDCTLLYYPLTKKGERFSVADRKSPILEPKPESRKEYLHGILQAISDVERDGYYRTLGELGATPNRPTEILTCGGGLKNDVWIAMRERRLRDISEEGS
jgi:xylulokinase